MTRPLATLIHAAQDSDAEAHAALLALARKRAEQRSRDGRRYPREARWWRRWLRESGFGIEPKESTREQPRSVA